MMNGMLYKAKFADVMHLLPYISKVREQTYISYILQ